LELLRITKENALKEITEYMDEISVAPAPVTVQNEQAEMPKIIVPDPKWFNGSRIKFKNWWREVRLFLKSNRITGIDDRITAIVA